MRGSNNKEGHKVDITLFDPNKNGHIIKKIIILKVKILLFSVQNLKDLFTEHL